MYINIGDKKISLIGETTDPNTLTLFVDPVIEMSEVFDLFSNNNIETIKIFNDDDNLYGVRVGYTNVDSFFYKLTEGHYVINLTKYSTGDLQAEMKKCSTKIDNLTQEFVELQNGELTKQSEYALFALASTFTDEQALNCVLLFPEWNAGGISYKKDERVRYNSKLYKVLLDHVSQDDWIPGSTPSLYVEITDPAIEYPEWKKPTGSHDAYVKGDKVTYNGKKYISKIDANTYSPEEYPDGWELVEE